MVELTARETSQVSAKEENLRWGQADSLSCIDGAERLETPRQIEFEGQGTRKKRAEQRKLRKSEEGPP